METKAKNQIGILFKVAAKSYPSGVLEGYFDIETGEEKDETGDTLALFIGREINSVFDESQSLGDNANMVYNALDCAISELRRVRDAIALVVS